MKEEIFVSGRANPFIDPQLHIWHWQIPLYLFLGGLAAGILFFAALFYLLNKEEKFHKTVIFAPFFVPVFLLIGLFTLLLDLKHKLFFWRLYTTIRFESPMSWGAWTLLIITVLSFIWAAIHIKTLFPRWDWKFVFLKNFESFVNHHKRYFAVAILLFSLILGVYTGILLSAFNARPIWNTSILGPLFLTSGLSTGAAFNLFFVKSDDEKSYFVKISLLLIGVELFIIIHMLMGFLASSQAQIDAVKMFLGGEFTHHLWIFDIGIGLVLPAVIEVIWLRRKNLSLSIPAALILFGGMMMRFTMVHAGQASRWLY